MLWKVFHIDINRTIIGTDSMDNAHLHQAVAEIIIRNMRDKKGHSYYDKIKKQNPKDYKTMCYSVIHDFKDYYPSDFIDGLPEDITTFEQLSKNLEEVFSRGLFPSLENY